MKPTIINAKNVLPGQPATILIKNPDGSSIICPVFKMLYDPLIQPNAPTSEQTGMAQG